jgi:cytoskeletal protein RodZ
LTELGNRLKDAREAKGYSLDDLQRVTKIQKRYLVGIEEGNYDMMPGKFYVRAFIKQYCEAVDLPTEEIFEEYQEEIPTTINEELPEQLSRVQTRKTVSENSSKVLNFVPMLLVILFVIGALVFVWYFVQNKVGADNNEGSNNGTEQEVTIDENKEQASKAEEETAKEEQEKKEEEKSTEDMKDENSEAKEDDEKEKEEKASEQSLQSVETAGKKTTYELKNANEFQLDISAKGDTWVEIYNSKDEKLFAGLLKDGQKQTADLSDDSLAYIIVGNAANTDIKVNEQLLEYQISATEFVRQDIVIEYAPSSEQ